MSLERIRDRATAIEQVVKEKYRRNRSQRACGEKNEVEQHGYEDSEKNMEATMRSQSSAQRREGEK